MFWKLKPVELAEMAEVYVEKEKANINREREKEKENWRRAAFLAAWIINTAGKTYKGDISSDALITFKDEVKNKELLPLTPEERKKQADETFMFHKSKAWMLFDLDSEGKVKVFDAAKLAELKERYKK